MAEAVNTHMNDLVYLSTFPDSRNRTRMEKKEMIGMIILLVVVGRLGALVGCFFFSSLGSVAAGLYRGAMHKHHPSPSLGRGRRGRAGENMSGRKELGLAPALFIRRLGGDC